MRRRQHQSQGTLFPFVSVLICIIGALSFLIIASGLTNSAAGDPIHSGDPILDRAARAGEERELCVSRLRVTREQLGRERKDLRELEIRYARFLVDSLAADEAEREADSLRVALEQLNRDVASARAALAEATGPDLTKILVEGSSSFTPIFIECRREGLVVLATGRTVSLASIKDSRYIGDVVKNVSTDQEWCLFFLVREGGVLAFDRIYPRVVGIIPVGYHPVQTEGELELPNWRTPEWLKGL